MSGRSLSKGTLGLKFMNKVQPKPLISDDKEAPAAAASASASSSSKSAPFAAGKTGTPAKKEEKKEVRIVTEETNDWTRSAPQAGSSSRRVIHEGSLLSFPLLSSFSSTPNASSSSYAHTYSSMPMTSSVVSGRRSFGGANAEIEHLNNPTLPVASTSITKPEETASQKKKRKKAERDELPLNVRSAPTTSNSKKPSLSTQTWKTDADEVKLGGGGGSGSAPASKKVKTEQGGFAKPAGFEGAAKGGKKKGKAKQVYGQTSEEPEPVWGKRGEAREWDEGKESEQSEEDDDDHGVFDVEESSSEEDSDKDVEELLMRKSSGGKGASAKGAAKAKFERKVGAMFRREEEGGSSKGAGGAERGKKGKKGKQ